MRKALVVYFIVILLSTNVFAAHKGQKVSHKRSYSSAPIQYDPSVLADHKRRFGPKLEETQITQPVPPTLPDEFDMPVRPMFDWPWETRYIWGKEKTLKEMLGL